MKLSPKSNYFLITPVIFILMLLFSCTKDEDSRYPRIKIIQPSENSSFSSGDNIPVKALVSDENRIEFASVRLLKENMQPAIAERIIQNISSKEYSLDIAYLISDGLIVSGNYYLRVNASDGTNEAKEFVKIIISAAPLKRQGIVLVSLISPGLTDVSLLLPDANGAITGIKQIQGDYLSSCVSSRYQYINISGITTGGITSVNIKDGALRWSIPSQNTFSYFTGLDFFNEVAYIGYRDGIIRGYDNNSSIAFSGNAGMSYYAVKSFRLGEYLVTHELKVASPGGRLAMYYNTSGTYKQSVDFNYYVVSFARFDDDNLFVFCNDTAGQGRIFMYKISENGINKPFNNVPSGKMNDAVQVDNNTYLIALPDAIYKYSYSPVNFVPFISLSGADKIKYDALNNELVICGGNNIYLYDYSGATIKTTYLHNYPVRDIHVLYNK